MRLTKDQADENRQRILAEAGRLFRERGYDGIGVGTLMREAGFTHGGFYNHFGSKTDLMAKVTAEVLATSAATLDRRMTRADGAKAEAFADYIARYLSPASRDDPGHACPIAALGVDVIRQDTEVKAAFADGLKTYLASLGRAMQAVGSKKAPDAAQPGNDAISLMASLIGGMVMARAVAGVDEDFSKEILAAVRGHILPGVDKNEL